MIERSVRKDERRDHGDVVAGTGYVGSVVRGGQVRHVFVDPSVQTAEERRRARALRGGPRPKATVVAAASGPTARGEVVDVVRARLLRVTGRAS